MISDQIWSVSTFINNIVFWIHESIKNVFQNAKKTLEMNSMAIMTACNPEIMEQVLDVASVKYVQ